MISNRNISTRSCTLNRRPVEHSNVYHMIIFPCDNSFSVVKSRQCSPAEQDGFVLVYNQAKKKYMGFIFETGKMDIDHQTMTKLFLAQVILRCAVKSLIDFVKKSMKR